MCAIGVITSKRCCAHPVVEYEKQKSLRETKHTTAMPPPQPFHLPTTTAGVPHRTSKFAPHRTAPVTVVTKCMQSRPSFAAECEQSRLEAQSLTAVWYVCLCRVVRTYYRFDFHLLCLHVWSELCFLHASGHSQCVVSVEHRALAYYLRPLLCFQCSVT